MQPWAISFTQLAAASTQIRRRSALLSRHGTRPRSLDTLCASLQEIAWSLVGLQCFTTNAFCASLDLDAFMASTLSPSQASSSRKLYFKMVLFAHIAEAGRLAGEPLPGRVLRSNAREGGGKLYRIYREEGLTVRKRGGRKRAVGTRTPMAIPQGPNQRWSLDFVSGSLSCGRRFRILNVIDDFSRGCLAAVVNRSLSGDRVGCELDRVAEMCGYPCMVVSGNGVQTAANVRIPPTSPQPKFDERASLSPLSRF